MCKPHWGRVPADIQAEVYRTVRMRGPDCDHTWAPWWRAHSRAIAHVAFLEHPDEDKRDRYLAREMAIADELERRSACK
jgi:hypothetical protein